MPFNLPRIPGVHIYRSGNARNQADLAQAQHGNGAPGVVRFAGVAFTRRSLPQLAPPPLPPRPNPPRFTVPRGPQVPDPLLFFNASVSADASFEFLRTLSIDDVSSLSAVNRTYYRAFTPFIPRDTTEDGGDDRVDLPAGLVSYLTGRSNERRDWALTRLVDWERAQGRDGLTRDAVIDALAGTVGFGPGPAPWTQEQTQQPGDIPALKGALGSLYAESRELARAVLTLTLRRHDPSLTYQAAQQATEAFLARHGLPSDTIGLRTERTGETLDIPPHYINGLLDGNERVRHGNMRALIQNALAVSNDHDFVASELTELLMREELLAHPRHLIGLVAVTIAELYDVHPNGSPRDDHTRYAALRTELPRLRSALGVTRGTSILGAAALRAATMTILHPSDLEEVLEFAQDHLLNGPGNFDARWSEMGADVVAVVNLPSVPSRQRNEFLGTLFGHVNQLTGPQATQIQQRVVEAFDAHLAQQEAMFRRRREDVRAFGTTGNP